MEKEILNNDLYKLHLKLAQEWDKSWHHLQEFIIEYLSKEMEYKYTKLEEKRKKVGHTRDNKAEKEFYQIPP